MKIFIAALVFFTIGECNKRPNITCNEKFFICANECSNICDKTIDYAYEFGRCFSKCNDPCRKDYCKDARMVKMVDTEDLKSFANVKRGGSSPSVSSILKRR